jgi:alpha-galactosidase
MDAMETGNPFRICGNVLNTGGLISNLPEKACVEVPCLVDRSGVTPTHIGELPEQLAALNRTNINTQLLTIEAAITGKKEHIYHAALLDPHTKRGSV